MAAERPAIPASSRQNCVSFPWFLGFPDFIVSLIGCGLFASEATLHASPLSGRIINRTLLQPDGAFGDKQVKPKKFPVRKREFF